MTEPSHPNFIIDAARYMENVTRRLLSPTTADDAFAIKVDDNAVDAQVMYFMKSGTVVLYLSGHPCFEYLEVSLITGTPQVVAYRGKFLGDEWVKIAK